MSGLQRNFSTFIGVDLGGGKGKNTAVARLCLEDDVARVEFASTKSPGSKPFYDTWLVDYLLAHHSDALLCIDAPLSPSVCLRCQLQTCPGLDSCEDPVVRWFKDKGDAMVRDGSRRNSKPAITAYTQRACEVVLHRRYGILPRETLGQGMGPLTARAHYLRRALADHFVLNENLIEVYPKATLHSLFGADLARRYKREARSWQIRARILESLQHELRFNVWREGSLNNDHCFDAVICAYTGYLWAKQGWTLPSTDRAVFEQDGWIWFPPFVPE